MSKLSFCLTAALLTACAAPNHPVRLPQQEGEVIAYRYDCAQGRVDVEYARMGGQDSATLLFKSGNQDEKLRKVLPRTTGNSFALDDLRWTGTDGGQYVLSDGGEILLQQCSGQPRSVFRDKDDHPGTVKLNLGRILGDD